jgi:hypothetical protein
MSGRNPRKHLSEDQFCSYVYPEDHPKSGDRCKAVKGKKSKFCRFHNPNPEARNELLNQLGEAREMAVEANTKSGAYATTYKTCNACTLAEQCNFYVAGKKVCDFQVNTHKIDLSSLSSIEAAAGRLIEEQIHRMDKMAIFFEMEPDNTEIFEASTRCAKRLMSMLKDYAVIKEKYEKDTSANDPWKDMLENM